MTGYILNCMRTGTLISLAYIDAYEDASTRNSHALRKKNAEREMREKTPLQKVVPRVSRFRSVVLCISDRACRRNFTVKSAYAMLAPHAIRPRT